MLKLMDFIVQSLQFQHDHLAVCLPLTLIGDSPGSGVGISVFRGGDFAVACGALECCCRCRPMCFAFVISGNPLFWKAACGDVL